MPQPSLAEHDYLRALKVRIDSAAHGAGTALVREAAVVMGCSMATVYSRLRKVGYSSGRKLRADKGDCRVSDDEVRNVAGIMSASVRSNAKRLLDFKTAMSIARANGLLNAEVSTGTMRRVMHRMGVHPTQLARATPYTTMRSEFPNQLWQLDASICVLYYLRAGSIGVMDEKEFYKNKPDNVARVANQRVIRYICTDHYTGSFFGRYYNVAGENQATLFEFLMEAMARRPEFVMHGVPWNLVWDAGAANTAHGIQNLLNALAIRHWPHVPGNPRAKGQVERMHDVLERKFEGRLSFVRVETLEQLNRDLDIWQRDYNGVEVHLRHGHARWGLWQTVRPEQLRLCPPVELCQSLMMMRPEPRTVKGNLTVQFTVKGYPPAFYSVDQVPNLRAGEQVMVTVNPYHLPAIYVIAEDETGATKYYACEPIARDVAGFPVDAPVFGQSYKAPADSDVDSARKDLRQAAFGSRDENDADAARRKGHVAFGGSIDAMKDLRERADQVPQHITRRGTELHVPNEFHVEHRPLDIVSALLAIKARIGRAVTTDESALVQEWFPDGVPETDLDACVARLLEPVPSERPRLAIVR